MTIHPAKIPPRSSFFQKPEPNLYWFFIYQVSQGILSSTFFPHLFFHSTQNWLIEENVPYYAYLHFRCRLVKVEEKISGKEKIHRTLLIQSLNCLRDCVGGKVPLLLVWTIKTGLVKAFEVILLCFTSCQKKFFIIANNCHPGEALDIPFPHSKENYCLPSRKANLCLQFLVW